MSSETVYHEAGHALMAYHVGAAVETLTIDPDWDDEPRRFGEIRIRWPFDWQTSREGRQRAILVMLSGPVAEMVYRGEPWHPGFVPEWSDDWRQAWDAAESLLPNPAQRLRGLEAVTRELWDFFRHDATWIRLATLADELDAHETLEEDQIVDVLRTWVPDESLQWL